jgi:hypothetical protein
MSTLNAWVGNAWAPVDLRGPLGDPGPVGSAGAFTWPGSNQQNYVNTRGGLADGLYEPAALTATGGGTTPATRVFAGNTSRVEVVTPGLLMLSCFYQSSAGITSNNSWINIRTAADAIVAAGFVELTDLWGSITALYPAVTGDVFKFMFTKLSGGTANLSWTIRTALIT